MITLILGLVGFILGLPIICVGLGLGVVIVTLIAVVLLALAIAALTAGGVLGILCGGWIIIIDVILIKWIIRKKKSKA